MTKEDRLYEQIKDLLEANLKPIRSDICDINKAIKGNGQPGLIQRVESLEAWKWRIVGIVGSLMFLINIFGTEIKNWILLKR